MNYNDELLGLDTLGSLMAVMKGTTFTALGATYAIGHQWDRRGMLHKGTLRLTDVCIACALVVVGVA